MHTHFDEQQFEQDLRKVFAAMHADPNVHDAGSCIINRNQEVSVQMGMMFCREINRGTNIEELAEAGVVAFLQFFNNIINHLDESDRTTALNETANLVLTGMVDIVAGTPSFELGEPAVMREMPGGHA